MFQVTRATEYAIIILLRLEKRGRKPLSLNQISKERKLPLKFLEKVAQQLKEAGIIESKKGVKGGYYSLKEPGKISLFSIVRAVEGKRGLVSCIHGKCGLEKACSHRKVWQNLQQKIVLEFKKISLKDLL